LAHPRVNLLQGAAHHGIFGIELAILLNRIVCPPILTINSVAKSEPGPGVHIGELGGHASLKQGLG